MAYTIEQLENAFLAADKAGNREDAQLFADELRRMYSQAGQQTSQPILSQPMQSQQPQPEQPTPTPPVQPPSPVAAEQALVPTSVQEENQSMSGLEYGMEMIGAVPEQMRLISAKTTLSEQDAIAQGQQLIDAGATPQEAAERLGADGYSVLGDLNYYAGQDATKRAELKSSTADRVQNIVQGTVADMREMEAAGERMRGLKEQAGIGSVTDIDSFGDFADYVQFHGAAAIPQLGSQIALAVATRSPSAVLGSSVAMNTGEAIQTRFDFIYNRLPKDMSEAQKAEAIAEYVNQTNDTSLAVGIVAGSLDMAGVLSTAFSSVFNKAVKKELLEFGMEEAAENAVRTLGGKELAKQWGKDVAIEGLTGAGQEITQITGERYLDEQTGKILSDQNIDRVLDSAAAEAAGGAYGATINAAPPAAGMVLDKTLGNVVRGAALKRAERELLKAKAQGDLQRLQDEDPNFVATRFEQLVAEAQRNNPAVTEEEAIKLAGSQLTTDPVLKARIDELTPQEQVQETDDAPPPKKTGEVADAPAEQAVETKAPPTVTTKEPVERKTIVMTDKDAVDFAQRTMEKTKGLRTHDVEYNRNVLLQQPNGKELVSIYDAEVERIANERVAERQAAREQVTNNLDASVDIAEARSLAVEAINEAGGVYSSDVEQMEDSLRNDHDNTPASVDRAEKKANAFKLEAIRRAGETLKAKRQALAELREPQESGAQTQEQLRTVAENANKAGSATMMAENLDAQTLLTSLSAPTYVEQVLLELHKQLPARQDDRRRNEISQRIFDRALAAEEHLTDEQLDALYEDVQTRILNGEEVEKAYNRAYEYITQKDKKLRPTKEEKNEAKRINARLGATLDTLGLTDRKFNSFIPGLNTVADPVSKAKIRELVARTAAELKTDAMPGQEAVAEAVAQQQEAIAEQVQEATAKRQQLVNEVEAERAAARERRRKALRFQSQEAIEKVDELTPEAREVLETMLYFTPEERLEFNDVLEQDVVQAKAAEKVKANLEKADDESAKKRMQADLEYLDNEFNPVFELAEIRRENEAKIEELYDAVERSEVDDFGRRVSYVEYIPKQQTFEFEGSPTDPFRQEAFVSWVLETGGKSPKDNYILSRSEVEEELQINEPTLTRLLQRYKERRLGIALNALLINNDESLYVFPNGKPRTAEKLLTVSLHAMEILNLPLPSRQLIPGKGYVPVKPVAKRKSGLAFPLTNEEIREATRILQEQGEDTRISIIRSKYEPMIAEAIKGSRAEGNNSLTNEDPVPALASALNGFELLSTIKEIGTPFQKLLATRLAPLLNNVNVVVVSDPETLTNPVAKAEFSSQNPPKGYYLNGVIYLNNNTISNGVNPTIALHEAIHAATVEVINRVLFGEGRAVSERQKAAVADLIQIMYKVDAHLRTKVRDNNISPVELEMLQMGVTKNVSEFIAYALTQPEMQGVMSGMPAFVSINQKSKVGWWRRFINTMLGMFNIATKNWNALQSLIQVADQLYVSPVITGNTTEVGLAAANRNRETPEQAALRISEAYDAKRNRGTVSRLAQAVRDASSRSRQLNALWDTISDSTITLALKLMYMNDTVRLASDMGMQNPLLVEQLIAQMQGRRNEYMNEALEIIRELEAFNKAHPDVAVQLKSTKYYATLTGVDPTNYSNYADAEANAPAFQSLRARISKATSPEESARLQRELQNLEANTRVLMDEFLALKAASPLNRQGQPRAVELMKKVRDYYRNMLNRQFALVREKINNSSLEGDINDPESPKGRMLAALVLRFEEIRVQNEFYIPLNRFGEYWAVLFPGTQQREFITAESMHERNLLVEERIAELQAVDPTLTKESMLMDGTYREGNSSLDMQNYIAEQGDFSNVLSLVNQELDSADITDKEQLRELMYRTLLVTMPERSMRKAFLERKKIAGFELDAVRSLSRFAQSYANQLSRLEFNSKIRNALGQAYAELQGDPRQIKKRLVVDSIASKSATELNPRDPNTLLDKASRAITQTTFLYLLTSAASALIQGTQPILVGMPRLASMFGVRESTAMAAKYGAVWNSMGTFLKDIDGNVISRMDELSAKNSSMVENSPLLAAAFDFGQYESNIFVTTTSTELAEIGREPSSMRQGNLFSRGLNGAAKHAGFLFYHVERISRENFYLMSFELAFNQAMREAGVTMTPEVEALLREYTTLRRRRDNAGMAEVSSRIQGMGQGTVDAFNAGLEAFDVATERARSLTDEVMLNFSNYNKPQLLQEPIVKIPVQFMSYTIQMTNMILRNFYTIVRLHVPRADRGRAFRFLAGMYALLWTAGGVLATPFYMVIVGAIEQFRELMRPDEDDDRYKAMYYDYYNGDPFAKRDIDYYIRHHLIPEYFGAGSPIARSLGLDNEDAKTLANMVEKGPVSVLTGWNIGSKVGMGNFLMPKDIPGDTPREQVSASATEWLLGPTASVAINFYEAFRESLEVNPDWARVAEKLFPGIAKGTAKETRIQLEGGEYTKSGYTIMDMDSEADKFTVGKSIGTILGFGSTPSSSKTEMSRIVIKMTDGIRAEKQRVFAGFNDAVRVINRDGPSPEGDKLFQNAMEALDAYNGKNGLIDPIRSDDVRKSLKGRAEARAKAIYGYVPSKSMQPFFINLDR